MPRSLFKNTLKILFDALDVNSLFCYKVAFFKKNNSFQLIGRQTASENNRF